MLIVAHRGAHEPEAAGVRANTLAAFRGAAGLADGVELDVRRTADGALVVVHDAAIDGRVIAQCARADLPDWVPTLAEALHACAGLAYVDVEVKNAPHEPGFDPGPGLASAVAEAVAEAVADTLAEAFGDTLAEALGEALADTPAEALGEALADTPADPPAADPAAPDARPRWIVTSFHLDTVDFARAAGVARTGWLTLPGYDQPAAIAEAARRGHTAIAPPDAATDAHVVDAAHTAGLEVVVWTVNDPARVAQLASWGVDVCITDHPRLAMAALQRPRRAESGRADG